MNYDQLCGALGMLNTDCANLNWPEISAQMREIGRRVGVAQFGDPIANTPPTGAADPVHAEVAEMHRKYRGMCLERGLIQPGYLFDSRDCVPLE